MEQVHLIYANLQICPIIVEGATVPQLCQCLSDRLTVATSLISWYIRNKVTGMEWCQRINVSPFENKLLNFTSLCCLPHPLAPPLFHPPCCKSFGFTWHLGNSRRPISYVRARSTVISLAYPQIPTSAVPRPILSRRG